MHRAALSFAIGIQGLLLTAAASAADCVEPESGRALFGAGTSSLTATLAAFAAHEATLPEAARIHVHYSDPGDGSGYQALTAPEGIRTFKYWDAEGLQGTCEAPAARVDFALTERSAALFEIASPGIAIRSAPFAIAAVVLVTHPDSTENVISAEALHFLYRFGVEHDTYSVAPWTKASRLLRRGSGSFQQFLLGAAIEVAPEDFQGTIPNEFSPAILVASPPESALGFSSLSVAVTLADDGTVKPLAYQHFGQSAGYLPDSSRERRDAWNVRTGQYALATPLWIHTKRDTNERSALVLEFLSALLTREDSPRAQATLELVVQGGNMPLCATHALRAGGDFSPLVSYAHENPCHGYYEYVATGSTTQPACDSATPCSEGACRFGFCEAH